MMTERSAAELTTDVASDGVGHGPRVAIMGAGSWGTALAKVVADGGARVHLWARRAEVANTINTDHVNADYLPGTILPDSIVATTDAAAAMVDAEAVIFAVPSQSLRGSLSDWAAAGAIPVEASLFSLAKGVEQKTLLRISEVIIDVTGADPQRVGVISGPNLAREIAQEQLAATVVACPDADRARRMQGLLSTEYFRPYTNTDVVGCEIGGACKNVIALACGMAEGQELGANTTAMIITRGLAEATRLAAALGADPLTLAGLAGIGDLVATCTSSLSRNRTFGERLGRGESLEEAQAATHGQVAEGVKSCSSLKALAEKHDVDMPLTEAVHRVCHDGVSVAEVTTQLMARTVKSEVYGHAVG